MRQTVNLFLSGFFIVMIQIGKEFVETPEETVVTQKIQALRAADSTKQKEVCWRCQVCGLNSLTPNTVTRRQCSNDGRYMVLCPKK